jgi:hypothetical protein
MTIPARARYDGYRFPAEIIGHAVWLYFRLRLASAWWRSCWPSAASSSATKRYDNGRASSASSSLTRSVGAFPEWPINGTSMRWFGHRPDLPFCHKKRETMILMRSAGATLALALLAALSPFVGSNAAANQCTQAIPGKFLRSYNMVIR